jgi:hypothetical protein
MKSTRITRRQVLGSMLAAPLVSFTGCGGGGAAGTPALPSPPGNALPAAGPAPVAGQVKPVLVYFAYQDQADQPASIEDNLPSMLANVTPVGDRFAQGALCYQFSGSGSSITVAPFAGFPQGDFALLLWLQSSTHTDMEVLRVAGTNGTTVRIEVNASGGLIVRWSGTTPVTMQTGQGVPSATDGNWHHIALQRYGSSLQLYLDGVPRAAMEVPQQLPVNPSITIGQGWSGAIDDVRLYNRAFPVLSIPRSVYRWTEAKALTTTDDLLAYFPFNGNTLNYLGYGVEGTPGNVTPTADRNGGAGAAYLFNGIDSSVAISPGFGSTDGEFAIGFWEQSAALGQMTALSASVGGIAGTSLDIVFNSGAAVQIYLNGVAVPELSAGASGALTDGHWHFVLLQRAGTELQLFVDGALLATSESTAIFFGGNSVMRVGAASGTNAAVMNAWNGALDEVQVYGRSLTSQEVVSSMGLNFLGRDGVGGLSFQGKMWLLGGWNPAYQPATNSEVWSSVDGVNWTLASVAPWEPRHDAGYAVFKERMWIVGGDKITGHYQNDVWSTADGVNWERATNQVPWANRATQYVLSFGDRLWLMGGQQIFETSLPVVAYNDVWTSEDGVNWQQVTAAAPWSPRGLIMGSVVFQGRMWVIGGGQYDVRTFNNDVWSSADGLNWTEVLAQAPWAPRQFQSIAVFDNKLWVLAGGDAGSQGGLNDVWYSTDGAQWTQLSGTPWIARHAATTIVHDNYLWLTGGSDVSPYNDVWKLGYAP